MTGVRGGGAGRAPARLPLSFLSAGGGYDGQVRRPASLLALCAALACAGERPPPPAMPPPSEPAVLRAPELARVRCLLVAPFENGSDAPRAGEVATAALAGAIDPTRAQVYPVAELRAVFAGTPLELPAGFGPSLAHELAGIVGADAALSGALEGRTREADPQLLVSIRLAMAGDSELLFAQTVLVRPAPGEKVEDAVRRQVVEAARPMLERLGDGAKRRCFDAERARTLRRLALGQQAKPAPAPAPAPPPTAAPATAARVARTPRQLEWAGRLGSGERFVLEDVVFAGRTAELQRDAGLADLAIAFGSLPAGSLRLEAFVDTTPDRAADERLSAAMAQVAGERLVALGVPRTRIAWQGRGSAEPLLPNFTARGRATNRRVEVVSVK